jgi:hypothetical protein
MAKKKNEDEPNLEYWQNLGWNITQSLGLWYAEKHFENAESKTILSGVKGFENLKEFMHSAETEFAQITNTEQGLVATGVIVENLPEDDFIDAKVEDSESVKNTPRVFEHLPVTLTAKEKQHKTDELLQAMKSLDQAVIQFDSVKKSHQSEVKEFNRDILNLRGIADTGIEWKGVECEQRFDFNRVVVDIFRIDTGEFVRSRAMKDHERQTELFDK